MQINSLKHSEVFVFGSNLNGNHAGGAARQAYEKFGAKWGNGIGIQGQSYAIPTLGYDMEQLPLDEIQYGLKCLIEYANQHKDKEFLLTPIGTGIAGYSIEELKSILPQLPENIIKVGNWN